jgi:hypothetical protein
MIHLSEFDPRRCVPGRCNSTQQSVGTFTQKNSTAISYCKVKFYQKLIFFIPCQENGDAPCGAGVKLLFAIAGPNLNPPFSFLLREKRKRAVHGPKEKSVL